MLAADLGVIVSTQLFGYKSLHREQGRNSLHFVRLDLQGMHAAATRARTIVRRTLVASIEEHPSCNVHLFVLNWLVNIKLNLRTFRKHVPQIGLQLTERFR